MLNSWTLPVPESNPAGLSQCQSLIQLDSPSAWERDSSYEGLIQLDTLAQLHVTHNRGILLEGLNTDLFGGHDTDLFGGHDTDLLEGHNTDLLGAS